jgi:hypothetical protein
MHSVHIPIFHVGSTVVAIVNECSCLFSRPRVTVRVVSPVDFPFSTTTRSIARARSFKTLRLVVVVVAVMSSRRSSSSRVKVAFTCLFFGLHFLALLI